MAGVNAPSFFQCFNILGRVTGRGSGIQINCATYAQSFLPEQVEKETKKVYHVHLDEWLSKQVVTIM